ncbi:17052_t:CDS:2, partial [Acaulospora morrowiae]
DLHKFSLKLGTRYSFLPHFNLRVKYMEPLLTLIKEVVDNKSQTPSLSNNISIQPNPQNYSPNKNNKENSSIKKNQQKDNIIDEFVPESEHLDFLLPQSPSQPSSFFSQVSSGHKLSKIEEHSGKLTTIKESKLENRLLLPTTTTLSRSSSEESASLRELEAKDLTVLGEENGGRDSYGTFQSRVYNHNRDGLSRILEGKNDKNCEESSINPKNITNVTPVTSSPETSTDVSSILHPSLSVSLDSIHSEKSVFGDMYSAIRDGHPDVAVSPCPSPTPISNTKPLRTSKDTKTGILRSMEDKYPSPGAYFALRSGPMGDLSGGLSPHKRPKFLSNQNTNRNERFPAPSIDTSRPERSMSGRMAMEGWPTSPRRMQLVSPRFKSLTDLVEDPEGSEQQSEVLALQSKSISSNNESSVAPSPGSLLAIIEDTENEEESTEDKNCEEPEQDHDINAKSKNDGRSRSSRLVDLLPSDNGTILSSHIGAQSLRMHKPSLPYDSGARESSDSILEDMKSISKVIISDETSDQEDCQDEEQKEKSKSRNEKRLSGSFKSNLIGIKKPKEESKPEPIKNSTGSRITSRFSSIQVRRTTPQMLTVKTPLPMLSETEDDEEDMDFISDGTNERPKLPRSSENSDVSTPSTPMTPSVQSAPVTPANSKSHSWRWPKRPFSPARGKNKETERIQKNDNPADHIGKVGNIWAKKTLGQLRIYHQRHSPSILNKGFGLPSPLKESSSPLLSPMSDLSDAKKSPAIVIPEQPLETINEEDEEDDGIGVWSSEEVDLTDSGVEEKSPRSPTVVPPQIIEEPEEPRGMKVSPEHLTVVGGPIINKNSPNASTSSLPLRSSPSNSSLAKHNAKPVFESTFMISNHADEPLRYEILWPAFRFDVSPAYGVVKPKSVTVIKISVMNKHLAAQSRREEIRESKRLMGILKGPAQNDEDRPLMGRTRILVLCENGERGEVIVDVVPPRKKTKGEAENSRASKDKKETEDKNFIRRLSKSGGRSLTRTVDDLIKAARARKKKAAKPEEGSPRSTSASRGKSTVSKATGSSSKPSGTPNLRRNTSSRPTSRPSSPESNIKQHGPVRKHMTTSSSRSRPNTPDTHRSQSEHTSPSPISRSRTPDENRLGKQYPQRKNFIYIGVPGNVSCPDTIIREENHSVFRIHNPTNKPVTWHLKTVTNPFLRRSDSTNSSQKINDEVFLIMKTSGLLRAGTTEKVVVSFRPMLAGTYYQSFMLEDSSSPETSAGGITIRIQGEGKVDSSSQSKVDTRKSTNSKAVDFEVSEKKILIPTTRVGRRKSVGIKINNPSNQLIRIKCKCEVEGSSISSSILSIPLSSVQIKPRAFVLLPVRFLPKEVGEVRAIVKLQAVGRSEVQVDIVAEGVTDTSTTN